MKVIGIQKGVKFQIDGNEFRGVNLWFSYSRDGVEGVATEKVFVNETKPYYPNVLSLKLGDEVNVTYNRFGKPDNIVPVK